MLPTFVVVLESVADALGHNVDSVSGPNCAMKPRSFELLCAEVGHLMVGDVLKEPKVDEGKDNPDCQLPPPTADHLRERLHIAVHNPAHHEIQQVTKETRPNRI